MAHLRIIPEPDNKPVIITESQLISEKLDGKHDNFYFEIIKDLINLGNDKEIKLKLINLQEN